MTTVDRGVVIVIHVLGAKTGEMIVSDYHESNTAFANVSGRSHAADKAYQSDDAPCAHLTPALLGELERTLESALELYKVPGVAVALVEGNKLAYARGFGVQVAGGGTPVDCGSVFRLASLTKTMTSLLIGALVDEGRIGWDQRVVEIWPKLKLPTSELAANLRVKHMVGFLSGLGPHPNYQYYIDQHTATEMLEVIATLPVVAPLGTFGLNEEVFSCSGYIAALAAGAPCGDGLIDAYDELIQRRILDVIGTRHATPSQRDLNGSARRAAGHVYNLATRSLEVAHSRSASGYAPGDGVSGCVLDIADYMAVMLSGGLARNGKRVVSPQRIEEIFTAQAAVAQDNPFRPILEIEFPNATSFDWALGWILVQNSTGASNRAMIGLLDGYTVAITLIPEKNIGISVLTNLDVMSLGLSPMRLIAVVQERLVELLYRLPARIVEQYAGAQKQSTAELDELASGARSRFEPESVAAYLGAYERRWSVEHHPADGTLWAICSGVAYQLIQMPGSQPDSYQVANPSVLASLAASGLPTIEFSVDAGRVGSMSVLGIDRVLKR